MKHFLLLLIAVLNLNVLLAQEHTIHPDYESKTDDLTLEYLDYDWSTLIIPKKDFLGFIGSNYRRIKIFYTSVSKDSENPENYIVTGISIVGNNKCNFTGIITITKVSKSRTMKYGIDSKYKNAGFKAQGTMQADYTFFEDKTQSHVGTFSGIMKIAWLVDKHGILHLNDIDWYSDNYKNNQHIGTWTPYGSENSKTCNWGTRRIPNSGDLDIGAGEFSVNPKYKENGWEFIRAF